MRRRKGISAGVRPTRHGAKALLKSRGNPSSRNQPRERSSEPPALSSEPPAASGQPPQRFALEPGVDPFDHLGVMVAKAFLGDVAEMRRQHDVVELAEGMIDWQRLDRE